MPSLSPLLLGMLTTSGEEFEKVSRQDTTEQKEKLQSLIFQPKNIDEPSLIAYLEELFSSKAAARELRALRDRVGSFGESLRRRPITTSDVGWLIKSVLSADLLSDENRLP